MIGLHDTYNQHEAHTPCLRDASDGGTKVVQLAEMKLGSEGLSIGQKDIKAETSPHLSTFGSGCIDQGELLGEHTGAEVGGRKGCETTDSSAMGLAASWCRKGGTSMETSIPCSHGGRALVVKGVEEVENAEANFKYQDKAEG
ncbi:hypothetical protein B296_00047573 [Ensete ventricosum]|uniref:Uncharacterized protein n=1 Tax=Ensete ventricosum TaxID=4639 RepID=A0A426YYV6_ENSVE|nr:hypothetical protein B296_00047573 [Ensete ventricosum]